jgi:hypothetical protein
MTAPVSFEELLDLAAIKGGPLELDVKSLGGRRVYVRNPTSGDVDMWRMWCNRHQAGDAPLAAKLVQLMLCDEHGQHAVPQTDEALQALAGTDPRVIDEIAKFCLPLVNDPGEDGVEAEKKD